MKKTILFIAVLAIMGNYFTSCTPESVACFNISSNSIDDRNDPIVGEEISFENCSTDADSYYWDFDDKEDSQKDSPNHSYTKGGEYEVTLEATNKKGTSTISYLINVLSLDGEWECTSTVEYTSGFETYIETLELEQEDVELEGELENVEIENAEVDKYNIEFTVVYGTQRWVYKGEINEDYDEMEGEITIMTEDGTYSGFAWSAEKTSSKSSHVKSNNTTSKALNRTFAF